MTTKIRNYTPHPITIRAPQGDLIVTPEPTPARSASTSTPGDALSVDGHEVFTSVTTFGSLQGLPPPERDVVLVCSAIVAEQAAREGRDDVYAPGTGPLDGAVRDDAGRIVAVTRLVRVAPRA
jgi:hypothetical protein